MREPPTTGSLSSDVLTRVVIVASSIVSPTLLPHPVSISGAISAMTSSRAVVLDGPFIVSPRQARSTLHAGGVIAGVDHQDFGGHAAPGRPDQEHRRVG